MWIDLDDVTKWSPRGSASLIPEPKTFGEVPLVRVIHWVHKSSFCYCSITQIEEVHVHWL